MSKSPITRISFRNPSPGFWRVDYWTAKGHSSLGLHNATLASEAYAEVLRINGVARDCIHEEGQ